MVENTIARMAKIPPKTVVADEKERLKTLREDIKKAIFGQDEAIDQIVDAIQISRAGLGHQTKPVGSFLFSGPTGVGKTEVSKQLAEILGVEFIRFDMSEYAEPHTVSRLIGAPPGYVGFDQGGLLTEAIMRTPHAVLVLDEIEKAHPNLFNLLLAGDGLSDADRQQRQEGGFSKRDSDHDDERRCTRAFIRRCRFPQSVGNKGQGERCDRADVHA